MRRSTINIGIALALGISILIALLGLLGNRVSNVVYAQGPDGYAVYYVAPGGSCGSGINPCYASIQDAVDTVDAPDDVVKVASGTYVGVHYCGGASQMVCVNKTVIVQGGYTTTNWAAAYPLTQPTILNAQGQGGVIHIAGDIHPTIEGLYITGGEASHGGGVYVSQSDGAVLTNNTIAFNHASHQGGGLWLSGGTATISGNLVISNTVSGYGGGIHLNYSDAALTSNHIRGNTAVYQSTGGGLSVFGGNARIEGNTIISNTAGQSGGGVLMYGGSSTLKGNVISNNSAGGGGGVYVIGEGNPMLNGNLIISNTANSGGGLLIYGFVDATLSNNVVADNYASNLGSGIYIHNSSPVLLHTTIARNTGGDGTGVYVTKYATTAAVSFTNTIVVSHTTAVYVASGCTATLEATLWGTATWANIADWSGPGTILTGTLNYWENPGFLAPDTGDYHIWLGSSALGAGVDTWVTDDVDGQTRPHYGAADLGADEWWPLVAVKSAVPNTAEAGAVVTYTLALRNVTTAAMNVGLTDTLPSQVTYLGGPVFTGGSGSYALGTITWTGDVYTDTPVLITWTVQLSQDVPYSTTIANTAVVSDAYGVFETDPAIVWVPPYRIHLSLIMRQLE